MCPIVKWKSRRAGSEVENGDVGSETKLKDEKIERKK